MSASKSKYGPMITKVLESDDIYINHVRDCEEKGIPVPDSAARFALYRLSKELLDAQVDALPSKRFSLFPVKCEFAAEATLTLEADHWSSYEVRLVNDRESFARLDPKERSILKAVIGFLHFADGAFVEDTMQAMLYVEDDPERARYYAAQLDQERIHAEGYERMLDVLVTDPDEKQEIRTRVDRCPAIKAMFEAIDDITSSRHKGEAYVRISLAEYLFFTPMFGIIHWFRHYRGKEIRGVVDLNNFIHRDEGRHCLTTSGFYLRSPELHLTSDEIHNMVRTNVTHLDAFVDIYLGSFELTGLTNADLKNYTRVIANELCEFLQVPTLYTTKPPLSYMTVNTLHPKTNQFEAVPTEYSSFNVARALRENIGTNTNTDGNAESESEDDNW